MGVGVNFVDVLDCWEFKNTNFKFSYVCAKFSALHFSRKILTDRLEILVCSWGMVGIVPEKFYENRLSSCRDILNLR